jgi:5-hydroxyisourate hydrolase
MNTISTHVLDTSLGVPAQGVPLYLERMEDDAWRRIGGGVTNEDGRVRDLLADGARLEMGRYRMSFETGVYYGELEKPTLYPVVRIVFDVVGVQEHYHIPLLLSPFGYSTYRGS